MFYAECEYGQNLRWNRHAQHGHVHLQCQRNCMVFTQLNLCLLNGEQQTKNSIFLTAPTNAVYMYFVCDATSIEYQERKYNNHMTQRICVRMTAKKKICNIILSLSKYSLFLKMVESTLKCVHYWFSVLNFSPHLFMCDVRGCVRACMLCAQRWKFHFHFPFGLFQFFIEYFFVLVLPSLFFTNAHTVSPNHSHSRRILFSVYIFNEKPKFFLHSLYTCSKSIPKVKIYVCLYYLREQKLIHYKCIKAIHTYISNTLHNIKYICVSYIVPYRACRKEKDWNLSLILNTWCEPVYIFFCRPVGKWTIESRIKATRSST